MRKQSAEFKLRKIKIEWGEDKITDAAGLGALMEVFDESPVSKPFKNALPKRVSNRSLGSYRLGLIQLSSFIYGHDALDDLEEFRGDPLFEAALKGEMAAPRTMGDFLRDFKGENIQKLNEYLSKQARAYRKHLKKVLPKEYQPGALVLDIDSTSHEQHAKQMEGLAWNYKDEWCLDSQVIYDELGFSHGLDLRSGNTKSGVGAGVMLDEVLKQYSFTEEKHVRGDSAYCIQEVIRTCINRGAKFTLTAHDAYTSWRSRVVEITEWRPWQWSEKDREKAQKRKQELPVVELGRLHWQPSWSESLRLPVVVKRTWIEAKDTQQNSLFDAPLEEGHWEYYAVVTNRNLYEYEYQEVMEFHQKRGNAENFIREEKYGYDLKHFPCQKLIANHAFALLAMVAHNILRWAALIQRPDRPHFSKKLRRRFIHVPGRLISHARQLTMRIPVRFRKEVEGLLQALRATPIPSLADSS